MATLSIQRPNSDEPDWEVEVPDSFRNLSPADQQRAANRIAERLAQGHRDGAVSLGDAPAPVDPKALSPTTALQPAAPDTSVLGALRHGVDNVSQGIEATNRTLGLTDSAQTTTGPANTNYDPASGHVVDDIRNGRLGSALSYLPRAVVENAPDLGGAVAAGRAGAALGAPLGPVGAVAGGLLGAGAYSAYRSFGQNVEARAENNGRVDPQGRAQPGASDYIGGAITTLGSAALDAVGARGLGRAATAATGTARLPGAALREIQHATAAAAREGATETTQSLVEQTGQTLGTAKGLTVDPAQALGEGLIGIGSGGAVEAGAGAARVPGVTARAIGDALVERQMGEMTPERAASVERVAKLMDDQRAATDSPAAPDVLMRSARAGLDADLDALVSRAREREWITPAQAQEIAALRDVARSDTEALATGTAQPGSNPMGLGRLDALQGVPDDFRATLRDLLRDRDTLSLMDRPGVSTRIAEGLGGIVGGVAGGSAGHLAGPIGAAVGGWSGAQAGRALGRRMADAAGSSGLIDRARRRARDVLEAQAVDPGDIPEMVSDMHSRLDDDAVAERMALGLAADEEAVARDAAQMAKTRAAWTKRRVNAGLDVTPNDLGGLTERDRLDLLERMRFDADRSDQTTEANGRRDADLFRAQEEAAQRQRDAERDALWQQVPALRRLNARAAASDASGSVAAASPADRLLAAQKARALAASPPPVPAPTSMAPATTPDTGPLNGRPDGIWTGWRAGLMRFAAEHRGVALSPQDVDAALAALVERGEVSPEVARVAQDGDKIGRRTLEQVTAEAIRGRVDPERPFRFLVPGASEPRRSVSSPEQYRSAASSYQQAAARAADRAHAAGDLELATLIEDMAANSEAVYPAAQRLADADALVESDPEARGRREAVLRPLLRRYRVPASAATVAPAEE